MYQIYIQQNYLQTFSRLDVGVGVAPDEDSGDVRPGYAGKPGYPE